MTAMSVHTPMCARIVDRLASRVGDARFKRYFEPSARLKFDGRELAVMVPTRFCAEWLDRQFGPVLREAVREESGGEAVALQWRVAPDEFGAATINERAVEQAAAAAPAPAAPTGHQTRAARENVAGTPLRHSLDSFVVGACNRMAYSAACQLAESIGGRGGAAGFGVLFLHGPSGVGKTHLLQGIASRALTLGKGLGRRIRYVTGEQFVNEFIASIGAGNIESFRKRYRGLDLLCLDDVHFLGGKAKTQEEFLHTFDALDLGGARVVLASDEHPRDLARLSRQITSRFASGMVVGIEPPDDATRLGLIRAVAMRRGLSLSDASVNAIFESTSAHGGGCSVREIEGAVLRVEAMTRLSQSAGGEAGAAGESAMVRAALGAAGGGDFRGLRKPVRVAAIVDAVCAGVGVERSDLLGSGRHKRVVLARGIAAYLARALTTHSFPEIAQALGKTNHSTMVTACQRIARAIETGATCACGPGMDGPVAVLVENVRRAVVAA